MKNLQLPFGVQDCMPQECYNKIIIQEKLSEIFRKHGFLRVETPSFEYFDVYGGILSRDSANKTFKMTDADGSLLTLRSDPTLQICRMAATKLGGVDKVFYAANSYEYLSDSYTSRSREFSQMGVELLGAGDVSADVEAITVAIEGLRESGLSDFMLELGQVDYFNGLTKEAGMSERDAKELRGLVNKKDMLGVEMFLSSKKVGERFVSQFLLLPTLFGDCEVLNKARKEIANDTSAQALNRLEQILIALKAARLDKYVAIDLGILRGEYYTGLVMKGISGKLGVPLLDGGRYDTLCGEFGASKPAVGFSIGIKRLLVALEREEKLIPCASPDIAYISDGKDCGFEYEYVAALRENGLVVEKRFDCGKKELLDYCTAKKIPCAVIISGGKAERISVGGEEK